MASTALIGIAAFALLCFVLLVVMYWNNERKQRARRHQTRADIADLSILFQTMRDIISQQKTLAKQFNQELDKKMQWVKQVLARGMEKNEKLYERQQQLDREVEEAQTRLESLQRQIAFLQESINASLERTGPPAPLPPGNPPTRQNQSVQQAGQLSPHTPVPDVRDILRPVPQAAAPVPKEPAPVSRPLFADSIDTSLPFEAWDAPDFSKEEAAPETQGSSYSPPPPETPGDAEAARKAFRTLLDMDTAAQEKPSAAEALARMPSPAAEPARPPGGNGSRLMAPLQKRVMEYSQAGMTVAEIARELGIGKGEVRLMLSLAKQSGG